MGIVKGLFSFLIVIVLVVAVLFVDFVYKTFSFTAKPVKTDAVVVLAGGQGRVEEGVRLYKQESGSMLFLIGVDPSVRKGDLFRSRRGERGGEQVYLENASRTTLENALYARELLEDHQVRSIRLITSRYHMKRALLIFRSLLPGDVAIYPQPVTSANAVDEWWSHGGSVRLLFSEFYKYCLFRFFFLFAPSELNAVPRSQ